MIFNGIIAAMLGYHMGLHPLLIIALVALGIFSGWDD